MYDDILGEHKPKAKINKVVTNDDLVQLTGDDIKALTDNDDGKEFWFKLIRLYNPKPKTEYRGKGRIHIQQMKDGSIGVLTPKPDSIPIPWAEYCDLDIEDNGDCVCEDYLMQIWEEK